MLAVLPLISSAMSAVMQYASTLGPMIAKYAPLVLEKVGKNLPKVINLVESISLMADVLCPNEKVESLGAKAMQADKKPEDFDRINDYIHYLREDVKIDNENLAQNAASIMARQAIGTAIAVKGVSEKMNVDFSLPFLAAVAFLDLEPKLILGLIKSYAQSGLNANDLGQYFSDKLSLEETHKHSDLLVKTFQATQPDMSIEQAEDAVMNLRQ